MLLQGWRTGDGGGGRTKLVQHVGHVFPIDHAVAVAIEYLEAIAKSPDLRWLQLR